MKQNKIYFYDPTYDDEAALWSALNDKKIDRFTFGYETAKGKKRTSEHSFATIRDFEFWARLYLATQDDNLEEHLANAEIADIHKANADQLLALVCHDDRSHHFVGLLVAE